MKKVLIDQIPFLYFIKSNQKHYIKISSIESIKERSNEMTVICTHDSEFHLTCNINSVIEVLNNELQF